MRKYLFAMAASFALPMAVHASVINFHDSNNGVGAYVGQGAFADTGNNVWNGFGTSGATVTGNQSSAGTSSPITFTATYNFNNGVVNAADQGMPQYLLGNQAGVNGAN